MNFIEEQQREAVKDTNEEMRIYSFERLMTEDEKVEYKYELIGENDDRYFTEAEPPDMDDHIKRITAQTITNTLNHILDSGLLEEKDVSGEFLCDIVYRMPPQDGDTVTHTHVDYSERKGHNTLARAVKAHLDELIKSTSI